MVIALYCYFIRFDNAFLIAKVIIGNARSLDVTIDTITLVIRVTTYRYISYIE